VRTAFTGLALLLVFALAQPVAGQSSEDVVHLLVPDEADVEALTTQAGRRGQTGWKRVAVPVGKSVQSAVADLQRELGVRVLVENRYDLWGPEDEPEFDEQWALENTGQLGGIVDADIDATTAWRSSLGSGVVVAVVDSGVNSNHPEIDEQMWTNPGETYNGLDDDANGFTDDVLGWDFDGYDNDPTPDGTGIEDAHGTLVAGIVSAEVNGVGITGVAPGAQIMNVKACSGGSCFSLDAAEAVYYAVSEGADVVILSFGGPVSEMTGDPPLSAAIDFARQHEVVVVTAAGNTAPDAVPDGYIIAPAELDHSNNVAVAATDDRDRIAGFSFYGPRIDIAAPGQAIVSTALNGYAVVDGTSFSAPHAAAAAALLLSADPGLTHFELVARLEAWTDRPLGVVGKVESGRLNVGALLTKRFIDMVGNTFERDASWAAERGVTQGCNPPENTKFCPRDSVPRKHMAAFLRRYLTLPPASKDYFVDDDGSIFEEDINRLAEAGITRGCDPPVNDRFCPESLVTREQMAAFLVRGLTLSENTHSDFSDVSVSNVFYDEIGKLATAGITLGCNPPENTRFCPEDAVTRGQMVAFLHRSDR
jgi:subtilisin family serine protease